MLLLLDACSHVRNDMKHHRLKPSNTMVGLHVAQVAQQPQRDAQQRRVANRAHRERKHVSIQHLQLAYDRTVREIRVLLEVVQRMSF